MVNYIEAENIQLIYSGSNYFEMLDELIHSAKETIHLQTYIFETDETGKKVLKALKKASDLNVKVYLLIDGWGSYFFPSSLQNDLISSGINFRTFSPLFSSESIFLGRRLHHKIIVVDKKKAMVGGINIANKYAIPHRGSTAPWLDYAVLIKGKVCEYLHYLCEQIYTKKNTILLENWKKINRQSESNTNLIRFRRNDWIKGKNEIYVSYREALLKAKKNVIIVASYFLPNHTFRKILKRTAERGVEIKILLAGKSDIASAKMAESYLYEFLLQNKIKIYEWTNSVMHGKAMIVDNEWITIGSYNMNYLSQYLSIELNVDIISRSFAHHFITHLDYIIDKHCTFVSLEKRKRKAKWLFFFQIWLAYNFYRIVANLLLIRKRIRLH